MRPILLCVALAMMTGTASAADLRCTEADKSSWLQPAEVQRLLEAHGFTNVGAISVDDGNCYVVQATDQAGATKTLYLDPVDGALMAVE